jgi:putative transposase
VVRYVQASHGCSERRACSVTGQHRSTQRKPLIKDPRLELRQRMHEIVRTRVHFLLKREGCTAERDFISRLYREEGLALCSKQPRRRKMVVHRVSIPFESSPEAPK